MVKFNCVIRFVIIVVLLVDSLCIFASIKKRNGPLWVYEIDTVPSLSSLSPHFSSLTNARDNCDFRTERFECRINGKGSVAIGMLDSDSVVEFLGSCGVVCKRIGKLSIPELISYNGENYHVSDIADWAFVTPRHGRRVGYNFYGGNSEVILFDTVCIPDGVKRIGEGAFAALGAHVVFLPEGIERIGAKAFAAQYIKTLRLPTSLKSIGRMAFCMNPLLKDVYWSSSVDSVPKYCFAKCIRLDTVYNLEHIKHIGKGAFFKTNIRSISIPDNMTEIPYDCFYGCEKLKYVKWPKNLKVIREQAFTNTILQENRIPDGVEYVGSFSCAETDTFFIPSSVRYIAPDALFSCKAKYFKVEEGNSNYISIDGVVYDKDMSAIIVYPMFKTDTVFKIPSGIRKLQDGLLMHNGYLNTLYIPKTVEYCDRKAFNKHNISKIFVEWEDEDDYDCVIRFMFMLYQGKYNVPDWDHFIMAISGDEDYYYNLNHIDRCAISDINVFYLYYMYYDFKDHRLESEEYRCPLFNTNLKIFVPYGRKNLYIQMLIEEGGYYTELIKHLEESQEYVGYE